MEHHRHLVERKVLADARLLVDTLDRVLGEAVVGDGRGSRVRRLSGIVLSVLLSFLTQSL